MAKSDGKQLSHPRVTKSYASNLIDKEHYHIDKELLIIVCLVRIKSGHRFVGEAIVANIDKFEQERGMKIARKKVIDQIIEREMYVLRAKLYEESLQGKKYVN